MELLLKQTVEHLGRVGDVVNVRPGYARNYLLPNGYAVMVTQANVAEIERARARALAEEQERVGSLKDLADKMADVSVTIEGRANEDGHLFGSVGPTQVAAALREKGFTIEDKQVRMENQIKEIGVFDVALHLHQDIDPTIKVWVVQEKPE